jgi:hypothetical protein
MKRLLLAAVVVCASALPGTAQQIGGTYEVDGTNFDGSKYGGTAEIRLTSDTTCEIYWTTGTTTSQGICMRNGIAFAAGYVLGDSTGLVVYEIKDDGTLEGLWTIAGVDGNGVEILTPAN